MQLRSGTTGTRTQIAQLVQHFHQVTKKLSILLSSSRHLLTPSIQVACQLAMISNCRYRFQKVKKHKFFDKHIWRYKNKCGILLYCFFIDVFPRWKGLLGKSSSTYYFYVHIILLSYSTPFAPGNYLLNISHCLTAWPVNFSQTWNIWASTGKHNKFKEMFPRCGRRQLSSRVCHRASSGNSYFPRPLSNCISP